jgi:hypothetical protein
MGRQKRGISMLSIVHFVIFSAAQNLVFSRIHAMLRWRRSLSMTGGGTFAEVPACEPAGTEAGCSAPG